MKLYNFIGAILAGSVLLGSLAGCMKDSEFLEEKSYDFNDKTYYQSQYEMETGLAACYSEIQYLILGQMRTNHSFMLMGTGLDTFTPTNANDPLANMVAMDPGNGYSRHWSEYLFNLVGRCNIVINKIDENTEVSYSTPTRKNELRAEAVFMKAWAYRCLAGMFGNVPILDKYTAGLEGIFAYEPSDRQAVWEYVKQQMTWAEENLPVKPRLTGTVTKAAAGVYLAEVNLALGDFKGAKDAATRVIDKTDGNYEIMTKRFGNRKDEKTDRYGNPLNPYWDLFRGSWGRNIYTGETEMKAKDSNPNAPDNKEAIWVCQYNYGTFGTGGGGDAWWRTHRSAVEACWTSGILVGSQSTRVKADGKTKVYFFGDNVACYPEGVKASSKLSEIPGCEKRYVANVAQDSLGARVPRMGTACIPTEYVYGDLWKDDPGDFRGSETMIQRNFFTAGGTRWFDEKAAMYAREKAAKGTDDENTYKINPGDTSWIFPRFWKFSDDVHPNKSNQQYDVDWYMIRVPEAYLLRAEAKLALGDKAGAADDINVLRRRANAKPCTADQVDIDYILDERTRELFGEEHRWITLNRLSCNKNCGAYVTSKYPVQDATTSNTMYERCRKYGFGYENAPGARESYTDAQGKTRHRSSFKPHNFQYPIPTQVIQSNSGFEYPQNPGY